jgi:hypothetical protein
MNPKDKDTNQSDQQDKGFAVHDKRKVGKEAAPEAESSSPGQPAEQAGMAEERAEATPSMPETERPDLGDPEQEEQQPEPQTRAPGGERGYVPLTFGSFIMSLSTSALIYLGQVPDPVSGKTITDLVGARQTIDLISLLKEKTKGNLTPDEESFIDGILYDLRMLFVNANK